MWLFDLDIVVTIDIIDVTELSQEQADEIISDLIRGDPIAIEPLESTYKSYFNETVPFYFSFADPLVLSGDLDLFSTLSGDLGQL